MHVNRKLFIAGAAVLATALVMAGCSKDKSSDTTVAVVETSAAVVETSAAVAESTAAADTTVAAETTAAAVTTAAATDTTVAAATGATGPGAGKTVKLAFAGPMTGDNGIYGQDQFTGMQLAVDEINAKGGVSDGPMKGAKLSIASNDDRADPNEGAAIAQKLCDDSSVMAVLGHVNSSVTLAAMPIYNRCSLPLINSYSSNPKITQQGLKNVFRTIKDDNAQAQEMATIMVKQLGMKKIAVIWENDDYGRGLIDNFKPAVEKLGGTIVDSQATSSAQTKDFSSILTKFKSLNPDGLAFLNTYTDAGLQTQQARQIGLDVPIVLTSSSNTPEYPKLAGSSADGAIIPAYFDTGSTDPAIVDFVKRYTAKFNKGPGESSALGYDAVTVVAWALSQGADSRESIVATLPKVKDLPLLSGPLTFNDRHEPAAEKAFFQLVVKDGKIVSAAKPG